MNAERLHVIALALHQELEETGLVDSLQGTIDSIQELVNQPHPENQKQLANHLKELYAALTNKDILPPSAAAIIGNR